MHKLLGEYQCARGWTNLSLFLLRLASGLAFLMHGLQKFNGDSAVGFFTQVGIPAAGFFGPFVTWLEIIGGIALILGVLTHWAAKLLAIDMIVAILVVHLKVLVSDLPNSYLTGVGGPELAFLLLVVMIALMCMGPGRWALMKEESCCDCCGDDENCADCKDGHCKDGVCMPGKDHSGHNH